MKKEFILGLVVLVFLGPVSSGREVMPAASALPLVPQVGVQPDFGRMPLFFVPDRGGTDGRSVFAVRGRDKSVYFAPQGLTIVLAESKTLDPATQSRNAGRPARRWAVKLDFVGANPGVQPEAMDKISTTVSYFKGRPEEWRTGIPACSKIVYANLWPGIDLVYSGSPHKLKYEFMVRPGADPSQIKLAYRGADRVTIDGQGRLTVATPLGSFQDDRPTAFQEVDGKKVAVSLAYALDGAAASEARRTYGFQVGSYDSTRPLVLDPTILIYCGFVGGAADDAGTSIAVDGSGSAYVVGYTMSDQNSFPETIGPDLTPNGNLDAFVAKIKTDGTGLVYCGYIGGSENDLALGVAVDSSGNAYVAGVTASDQTTFPVFKGPSLVYQGGTPITIGDLTLSGDAFVAKINAAGTSLAYCGYIGGTATEVARGIAVNSLGAAYVTGVTMSSESSSFPVKTGPDTTMNGPVDAFVAKVKSDGTGLDYCGYIGGLYGDTWGQGLALDASGFAYVTGFTKATDAYFPVNGGPDVTSNGGYDAFIAKVKADGTGLTYCGYVGGAQDDRGFGIAVDGLGCAYITGDTKSDETSFPELVGPDLTFNGGDRDAFVAKVKADGTGLDYCGYIGGSNDNDSGNAVAVAQVAGSWTAYITGSTNSSEYESFPVTLGPGLTYGSTGDAFLARVTASGEYLVFCGYIGGPGIDNGIGLAVDSTGTAYVCGWTNSLAGFPAAVGPDLSQNGNYDAFVAKVTSFLAPPVMTNPPNGSQQQPTNGINFQWTDPNSAPQEDGYVLRLKYAGAGYTSYQTQANATALTIGDSNHPFAKNSTLYWNVMAKSSNATDFPDSAWANGGNDFVFRTLGSSVLFAPNLVSPPNGSSGQPTSLTLAWTDINSNPQETKYRIRVKPAGGAYTNFTVGQNVTSYLLAGRAANKTYYWSVQAAGNGTTIADSPWANGGVDWTFTTAAPVRLNPPVLVSPANAATDQPLSVTLRWTDTNSSPQELGYQVRFKRAGGTYAAFNTAQNVVQLTKSGLLKNKTYSWNVRARGDGKGLLTSVWANGGVDWKFMTQK